MSSDEGSLHLPSSVGAPDGVRSRQTWSTLDQVKQELEARGIPMLPVRAPGEFPILDKTDLTAGTEEYTNRFVEFVNWLRYSSELMAEIDAQLLEVENEMSDIEVEVKRTLRGQKKGPRDGPTAEDIKIAYQINPRWRDLNLLKQRTEQAKILLKAKMEGLDLSRGLMSRNIELKKADLEGARNEHNMPMRGAEIRTPRNWNPFSGSGR